MPYKFNPETSRLLADVAGLPPQREESPEARLTRMASDPLTVFAELNRQVRPVVQPQAIDVATRARIADVLVPVARAPAARPRPTAIRVVHDLKSTAPAIATHIFREEKVTAFQPSATDLREAIDVAGLHSYFPALAITAASATSFLLWLLI